MIQLESLPSHNTGEIFILPENFTFKQFNWKRESCHSNGLCMSCVND